VIDTRNLIPVFRDKMPRLTPKETQSPSVPNSDAASEGYAVAVRPAGGEIIAIMVNAADASQVTLRMTAEKDDHRRTSVFLWKADAIGFAALPATTGADVRSEFDMYRDISRILSPVSHSDCSGCWAIDACADEELSHRPRRRRLDIHVPCGWLVGAHRLPMLMDIETVHLDLGKLLPA
jgi:hypothetical protein